MNDPDINSNTRRWVIRRDSVGGGGERRTFETLMTKLFPSFTLDKLACIHDMA